MTIEFIFQPPPDLLRPSHIPPDAPITLTTHRNNIDAPLLSLIRKQISDKSKSKKDGNLPDWLRSLVFPDDRAAPDPRRPSPSYHKLDCSQKLAVLLRQKQFVEFPVIEIWEDGSFTGLVVDDRGMVSQDGDDDRERGQKRRKLNVRQGKAVIKDLLGDYRSDEEEPEEREVIQSILSNLDDYADSEIEQEESLKDDREVVDEDWDEEAEDDEEVMPGNDPALLLEKLKASGVLSSEIEDQDEVDWGDSD